MRPLRSLQNKASICHLFLLLLIGCVSQLTVVQSMDAIDAELEPQLAERLRSPPLKLPQEPVPQLAASHEGVSEGLGGELRDVYYLHGRFEPTFLDALGELAEQIPRNTDSMNMVATRRFFKSEVISEAILRRLPTALNYTRVLPDMRFIEYPCGGYITPHTDGIMFDTKTGKQSTTSFLLYLRDTKEGGTTDFLTSVKDGEIVHSVAPMRGSILLFPHRTPHEGTGVGSEPKVLLRGDLL